MILRHHSSDQHYTGFDQGLMQQGRVLGQDCFTPAFGRGRKPAMGHGYSHNHYNHYHIGWGRGFQKPNYYRMPAACCDHGLYGPSNQSYAVQPGLINVPSFVNPSLYMQSPYLLQAVPVTPQIQMQSTAATKMEDSRSVSEKSTKTVKLEPRECTFCKKIGTFQCKRCKIPYCCTDCQKQDWPQHKNYCSKIKEMQNTDEFKDFDVTFGEDIVDNVKNLIEKHTGDAVVVDKSPLEKTCSVQQQQNRKSGKQTGKTSMGDQSGKVRESSDAQDIQPRSKVADYNRKDISRGSDKGHVTVGNQIGQTSQNRSPHKNKMAKTQSEDYNRGKEKNDQPGNRNRRGGAERKNDFQTYQSRNKQKDGRTVASEQDWEDVTTEEQFVSSASQDIIPGTTMERQVVLAKDFPCAEPFGSEFGIVITSVVDSRCFYCQLADEEVVSAFGDMMDRLSEHCQSEPALPDVVYTEGELCSAKFQADGKWYRACIKQLNPNGTALVYYVDFGNEEVISLDDLNSLTEEFQTLPILALRCSLSGIHPIDGAWKPEAVNVLKSLQEQVLRVKLVEVFDNTYYLIVLHTRDGGETVSLNQILIEAGLAEATPVRKPSPAHAESEVLDGGEKGLVNTGRRIEKSLKIHSSSQVTNTATTTTTNMTLFKCNKCCATYTSQKSLRQHCRDKHGDRISCPYDGCTYTCAKSRQQHLTSHINNVHPVLGRGYETYSPVSSWRMDRPGKIEAIRRMREEEHPKQYTDRDETGGHVGRRSQEEEKMDHSDSDSERLSVLADRIDFDYGMNDLSSPESIELAEPLFSSPRRVAREPSEEATQPHHAGDKNNPITNVPSLNSSETLPSCTAIASHQGEENPLIAQSVPRAAKDEALSFLTFGGMPLYPPAMRNWSGVEEESILMGRMLRWPPRKWSTMTEDAKLMIWEMAALSLEKELDPDGQPHRNTLLEKYNFLALPGTAQPKIVDGQSVRFMRFHNFCALRDIVTSAEDPNGLLESFRRAAEVRDQSTDNVIRGLQGIPVWI